MKLGFIGVGNMGGPMCGNLIKHDYQVIVHDPNEANREKMLQQGASEAASAKEVAEQSEVVFTSLPGPSEIEAVTLGPGGIAEGSHDDLIYVDLSTNSPTGAAQLATEMAERGIAMVDAPVSGGVDGARAATISVMVGGDKAIFDKVEPLLRCIGKNVYHVGAVGAGCTVKLINNMLAFINLAALGEGALMGVRAGVDPKLLLEVISTSSGGSHSLARVQRKLLAGDFATEFSLDLAHKDLRLALQLGEETGTPLMFGGVLVNMMRQSVAKGHGPEDLVALLRLMEETLSTQVRG